MPFILITGASGYLGGYITKEVLEAGYEVRLTARPQKVEILRKEYGETVEVVPVADIIADDLSDALKDVSTIIHLAFPLPGLGGHEIAASHLLALACEGTMNLVRQGAAKGVKKIVFCSSILAVTDMTNILEAFDNNHVYTSKDWNPATKEDVLGGQHHPWWIYGAAKAAAEQEVWKFADEHPEIDITTIAPGFVYGPCNGISIPIRGSLEIPSSPIFLYANVFKLPSKAGFPPVPSLPVDIRDCARAHLLAISAPPSSEVGRKRFLLCAPGFTWAEAVAHLRKVRPELSERLLSDEEIGEVYGKLPQGMARVDCERTKEVLGFGEFIPWQKTVEDCVDDLLIVEKGWNF